MERQTQTDRQRDTDTIEREREREREEREREERERGERERERERERESQSASMAQRLVTSTIPSSACGVLRQTSPAGLTSSMQCPSGAGEVVSGWSSRRGRSKLWQLVLYFTPRIIEGQSDVTVKISEFMEHETNFYSAGWAVKTGLHSRHQSIYLQRCWHAPGLLHAYTTPSFLTLYRHCTGLVHRAPNRKTVDAKHTRVLDT